MQTSHRGLADGAVITRLAVRRSTLEAVLLTMELLVNILANLSIKDLGQALRVSRKWHDVINNSPVLRRALFLSLEETTRRWLCDTRFYEKNIYKRITEVDSSVKVDIRRSIMPPLNGYDTDKFAGNFYMLNPCLFSRWDEDDIIDRIHRRITHCWELQKAAAFLSANQHSTLPRRDMFISQPPLKSVIVDPCWKTSKKHTNTHFSLWRKLEAPQGITVQHLVQAFGEIMEQIKKREPDGFTIRYFQLESAGNILATVEDVEWVDQYGGQVAQEWYRGKSGPPWDLSKSEELWKRLDARN
jgi:hypothetical protein